MLRTRVPRVALVGTSATANGDTVEVLISLISGVATGSAVANGAVITIEESLVSGGASGSAVASGQTTEITVNLISGIATGSAQADGDTVENILSLISGTASGGVVARGQVITVDVSLVSGGASGSAVASGQTVSIGCSLIVATIAPTDERIIIKLRKILLSLLGEDGINCLGQYQIGANYLPALQIRNTTIPYKLVPRSGIECVIEPNADIEVLHTKARGIHLDQYYLVTLDQHNPAKSLTEAIEAIYAHPTIRPLQAPVIRGRTEYNGAELPARAILYIPFFFFQRSLF